jgi:divalent metal cation (Fe/Co/Zn/Cd) transporter
VRRLLLVTLALNITVVAGKLVAGLIAGSLNVISDATHSPVHSLNDIRWLGGDEVGNRSA